MADIYKKYPVKEIAILTQNYNDHLHERAKEGDIIAIRKPHNCIGTKEQTNYLWLRIEGLEELELELLNEENYEGNVRFEKRRYCIPLHRLKEVYPAFDITRARDMLDKYQPFMIIDEETGRYLTPVKPFNIHGLIFDKTKGEYL